MSTDNSINASGQSSGRRREGAQRPAAKLHHYVPQGYLRGFATDRERLTVVPLDRSRQPFTSSVKNVAAQTHFHTIPGSEQPDEFEKLLASLEGEALGIVRSLEAGRFPLPEGDRWAFSHYMALQAVRGPDTRKTMEQLKAKMVRLEVGAGGRKNIKSWIKKNLGLDATDEQADRMWNEATQPDGPPITFSNVAHIQHMVETAEYLTPYLATRPWLLVRFNRRALTTSDAPVSLIRNDRDEPWQGVGFATAWGISFPLTRRLGLLMTDPTVVLERLGADDPRIQRIRGAVLRGEADRVEAGTTAMEKLFNDYTAGSAREYLYHHPDDANFVPSKLHEPTLINMGMRGLSEMEFNGEPWFPDAENLSGAP